MELDIRDLALLVDEGEGMHSKAFHVTVVQRNAYVILQEGELQRHEISQPLLAVLSTLRWQQHEEQNIFETALAS